MVRHRNNIIMAKRDRPKEVVLPNGRRFLARYRCTDQTALPANIRFRRTYRGRSAQGRRARIGKRAKPAHQIRRRGFKDFEKKKHLTLLKKQSKESYCQRLRKNGS